MCDLLYILVCFFVEFSKQSMTSTDEDSIIVNGYLREYNAIITLPSDLWQLILMFYHLTFEDRIDLLRKAQNFGGLCRIIAKRTDIANAKPGGFRRDHQILRIQRGIDSGNDELFGQPLGRRAAMLFAAAHRPTEIGTEHQKITK